MTKTLRRWNPKKHPEQRRKARPGWKPAEADAEVVMMIELPKGIDKNSEEAKKYFKNNPQRYLKKKRQRGFITAPNV